MFVTMNSPLMNDYSRFTYDQTSFHRSCKGKQVLHCYVKRHLLLPNVHKYQSQSYCNITVFHFTFSYIWERTCLFMSVLFLSKRRVKELPRKSLISIEEPTANKITEFSTKNKSTTTLQTIKKIIVYTACCFARLRSCLDWIGLTCEYWCLDR